MERSKIKRMILVIVSVFIISVVFTLLGNYPWEMSSFDLGKSTGLMMKSLIKVLVLLSVMAFLIRTFNIEKLIYLFITVFIFSLIITLVDNYPWDMSSYDLGKLAGLMLRRLVENLFIIGMIVLTINRFKLNKQS